jgi:hypothetical protein
MRRLQDARLHVSLKTCTIPVLYFWTAGNLMGANQMFESALHGHLLKSCCFSALLCAKLLMPCCSSTLAC